MFNSYQGENLSIAIDFLGVNVALGLPTNRCQILSGFSDRPMTGFDRFST